MSDNIHHIFRDALAAFAPRPVAKFVPGRESLWETMNPIASDGLLRDVLHKAQESALDAVTDLLGAARCSAGVPVESSLSEAAIHLHKALEHIQEIRMRLVGVPADFGDA